MMVGNAWSKLKYTGKQPVLQDKPLGAVKTSAGGAFIYICSQEMNLWRVLRNR